MRCALCGCENVVEAARCSECDARLDPWLHEEFSKLEFLLDEIKKWLTERKISQKFYIELSSRYRNRRKRIQTSLIISRMRKKKKEPEEPEVELEIIEEEAEEEEKEEEVVKPPVPELLGGDRLGVRKRRIRPPRVHVVPKPPAPRPRPKPVVRAAPMDFKTYMKRLFSDRNIRIVQQLGIFIFIAGAIAFVYSQWETWSKVSKILSMVLMTTGFFASGSLLRRKTPLRWTAVSVTMLGSLFVVITCFVGVHHKILPGYPSFYWLLTCVISVGINGFLARALSEEIFAYFAWIALYGLLGSMAELISDSYEALLPPLSALSVVLLLLRPAVIEKEKKDEKLEISYSRPLSILVNIAAAALLVLFFIFVFRDGIAGTLRESFVRHFLTAVFLAGFGIIAAQVWHFSLYLYLSCILKVTAFIIWVLAFEPDASLWVPLLMTLGVGFYVVHLIFKLQERKDYALPYQVFGTLLRGLALAIAVIVIPTIWWQASQFSTLLWTLGQFLVLCTGIALYTQTREDAAWMLSMGAIWLAVLLGRLEVGIHNFPAYFLALAAGVHITGFFIRETMFAALRKPLVTFTHTIGVLAIFALIPCFGHYIQKEIGHGLVNIAAAVAFCFYVGVASQKMEWLTTMFVTIAGLLALILHNADVAYYHIGAWFGLLASVEVLLTAGGIEWKRYWISPSRWKRHKISPLQPFSRMRPNLPDLRKLLSGPALAGSLIVAGIALILFLVAYGVHFKSATNVCTVWPACLLGLLVLAGYCVAGALSAKREEFEYAALVLVTLSYLLFLQSHRVTLSVFAPAAALFCVAVVFTGLLFSFLNKKFMSRSALQFGLLITGAAVLAMLFNPQSYKAENLLSPALMLAVAAAVFCYFSLRRQKVFMSFPLEFTYIWSGLAAGAYAFLFMYTGAQFVRDLYTVPAAGALLACSVLLRRKGFKKQHGPVVHVSYAASVAPFIFILAQAGSPAGLSQDPHITLITALLAICAYHVAAAAILKLEWLEYAAAGLGYMAYVTFLLKIHVTMPKFGLFALPAVFTIFLVGMVFTMLKKRLFTRSAFLSGLCLLGVSVVIPLFHPSSYQTGSLPYIYTTQIIAAGVAFYFALRGLHLFDRAAVHLTYVFGILLLAGYSFFFLWSEVQVVRNLYTVPVAGALLALSVLLRRKGFNRQHGPAGYVSYAACVAPFVFMLAQVAAPGEFSTDVHVTLITALLAVCAYHVAAAVVWKMEWLEYAAIAAGYLAYVSFLLKYHISMSKFGLTMPKFGFSALPAVFGVFLTGQIFSRLKKRLFSRSAFMSGLVLLACSVVIPMCHPASYLEENLPFIYTTLLIAAGVMCYFAIRRFVLFEKAARPFSYTFAVLLCLGHGMFLKWLSTDTPLSGLYFLQVSVLLVIVGWILKRFGFERQWRAPCFISFAATGVAMYLAISKSNLTAMLVFIACSVLYGVLHMLIRYRFFLWAATVSFSTAYFFTLRHLGVEIPHYLLWFSLLSALQVAFAVGVTRARKAAAEVLATPVFVVGMLTSFSAMVVMLALSKKFFTQHIDMAIVSTLIAAGTYFLCARRTKNIFLYYLSSLTALGAYYLLLHKYEVTMAEFFTVPVAGIIFAATTIHFYQGIKNIIANWGYAAGICMLLLPSLIRSLWITHLDSCLIAFALSFGCVLAAMMFRRKIFFGGGLAGIGIETVIKVVHFIVERHLSKGQILMIVGGLAFAMGVIFELIRNPSLRQKAGLGKLKEYFSDWT